MWIYHSRKGKGKGDREEKGNMGLGGGLIAGGKVDGEKQGRGLRENKRLEG